MKFDGLRKSIKTDQDRRAGVKVRKVLMLLVAVTMAAFYVFGHLAY
jgi:hypothetical protein